MSIGSGADFVVGCGRSGNKADGENGDDNSRANAGLDWANMSIPAPRMVADPLENEVARPALRPAAPRRLHPLLAARSFPKHTRNGGGDCASRRTISHCRSCSEALLEKSLQELLQLFAGLGWFLPRLDRLCGQFHLLFA